MKIEKIKSNQDNLELELAILECDNPKGIVQISHGMSEHKERYYPFMEFLKENNYISVIHDHRGHGGSIKSKEDLGYFYDEENYIVQDLYQITNYIKEKYDLPIYLFSHSMGTLVARNYMKKYDSAIEKVILCGPPTENKLSFIGIKLAKIVKHIKGDKYRSNFINNLTFKEYNKNYSVENEWVCSDKEVLKRYSTDPLCGYIFTVNGFINLFKLMKNAFSKNGWLMQNKDLKIFVIAGSCDPVIQNKDKFNKLILFLKNRGYKNIEYKLYEGKRHELLNETNKKEVYNDVLEFIEK